MHRTDTLKHIITIKEAIRWVFRLGFYSLCFNFSVQLFPVHSAWIPKMCVWVRALVHTERLIYGIDVQLTLYFTFHSTFNNWLYQRIDNNCQFDYIVNGFNGIAESINQRSYTILHGLWHFRNHCRRHHHHEPWSPLLLLLLLLLLMLMCRIRVTATHPFIKKSKKKRTQKQKKSNIQTNKRHHKICSMLCTWWNLSNSLHVLSHQWGFINKLCWKAYTHIYVTDRKYENFPSQTILLFFSLSFFLSLSLYRWPYI